MARFVVVYTTQIVVSNMQFLDKKESSAEQYSGAQGSEAVTQAPVAGTPQQQTEPKPEDDFIEDDIPF